MTLPSGAVFPPLRELDPSAQGRRAVPHLRDDHPHLRVEVPSPRGYEVCPEAADENGVYATRELKRASD